MRANWALIFVTLLLTQLLAGCTGVLEETVDPRASLTASPTEIQQGEGVTFDALDSDAIEGVICLLYTSPSPRDLSTSRMPSSA